MLALFAPVQHTAPPAPVPVLSHEQVVWSYALEWCESRGETDAINPKDADGTPSYGAFQFKPDTFLYFANRYDVATSSGLMSYSDQRAVLEAMLFHEKDIDWQGQFPDCVRKHIGFPPS